MGGVLIGEIIKCFLLVNKLAYIVRICFAVNKKKTPTELSRFVGEFYSIRN